MVVRVVDEREADTQEGLVGAQLDLHGDVGRLQSPPSAPTHPQHAGRPGEAAGDRQPAAHGAGQVDLHRDGGWRIDHAGPTPAARSCRSRRSRRRPRCGRRRRRPRRRASRAEACRRRGPRRSAGRSLIARPSGSTRTGFCAIALILHRADGGPAEGRSRDRRGERAPRSRHDPDPPRVVGGRAHRGGHLRPQPVHVEPGGSGSVSTSSVIVRPSIR